MNDTPALWDYNYYPETKEPEATVIEFPKKPDISIQWLNQEYQCEVAQMKVAATYGNKDRFIQAVFRKNTIVDLSLVK